MKRQFLLMSLCICIGFSAHSSLDGPNSGFTFSNVAIISASVIGAWQDFTDGRTSDDAYCNNTIDIAGNGDHTNYLQAVRFSFALAADATIDGITVEIEKYDSGTSGLCKDYRVRIVKGSAISSTDRSDGALWPTADADAYTSYGGTADLWGETWTPADINASTFGVAIAAYKDGAGGTIAPKVDHVRITVHYTTPLPVDLLYFEGVARDGNAELKWATSAEINNDKFIIQRSASAFDFQPVLTIAGAGSSNETLYYQATDDHPLYGQSYYRLKQVDFDGTEKVSKPVLLNFYDDLTDALVYPNPIGRDILNIIIDKPRDKSTEVWLVDISGKRVQNWLLGEGLLTHTITLSNHLRKGNYVLQNTHGTIISKVLVQ